MSNEVSMGDFNISIFNEKIDEAKEKYGVKDQQELKKELPKQDSKYHGTVELVSINDVALTNTGELTKTAFFEKMNIDKEVYGDIALTTSEARSLKSSFNNMTTGVNSVIPMKCSGDSCPFSDSCWFYNNEKAPVGKPCIVEHQLLRYHTSKFFEEFEIDINSHSEVMLIQELSELIVFEMRVTRVLSNPENATLMGLKLKFSPDGEPIEEETEHWAWGIKEKIKNRRMKILASLNATRQAKIPLKRFEKDNDDEHLDLMRSIKNTINMMQDDTPYKEIPAEEANVTEETRFNQGDSD